MVLGGGKIFSRGWALAIFALVAIKIFPGGKGDEIIFFSKLKENDLCAKNVIEKCKFQNPVRTTPPAHPSGSIKETKRK